MSPMRHHSPVSGFLLLPPGNIADYRGVDRGPFEPILLEQELASSNRVQPHESRVWAFYPPGWRQDAYRLYEEHAVRGRRDAFLLISTYSVAKKIQEIIQPHIGFYEILACDVWDLEARPSRSPSHWIFLGYDIAYPGGDFYSAILNGLLVNPHPGLVLEYKPMLNENGLFEDISSALNYIAAFKEVVSSEANSEFRVFGVSVEP